MSKVARWTKTEEGDDVGRPLKGSNKGLNNCSDDNNPWIKTTLMTWWKIHGTHVIWSSFPNRSDARFKAWVGKGLIVYCGLEQKGLWKSFETLKEDYRSTTQTSKASLM